MYPQAAAPFEESGSNFISPTMGALISDQRKLTEANRRLAALDTASRESYTFHETRARRLGIDSPAGMAHLKAARAIRAGRLSNLYEHGDEIGELDPKAIMRANRDAVSWHKKRAEKHGLDSDIGHAHVAMLSDHLNAFNKAKKQLASVAGVAGRQSPLAVPEKSKQPSEDIRQRKPLVKLQQGQYLAPRYEKSHEARRLKREAALKEFGVKGMKWGSRAANRDVQKLRKLGFKHVETREHPRRGDKVFVLAHPDGREAHVSPETGLKFGGSLPMGTRAGFGHKVTYPSGR